MIEDKLFTKLWPSSTHLDVLVEAVRRLLVGVDETPGHDRGVLEGSEQQPLEGALNEARHPVLPAKTSQQLAPGRHRQGALQVVPIAERPRNGIQSLRHPTHQQPIEYKPAGTRMHTKSQPQGVMPQRQQVDKVQKSAARLDQRRQGCVHTGAAPTCRWLRC